VINYPIYWSNYIIATFTIKEVLFTSCFTCVVTDSVIFFKYKKKTHLMNKDYHVFTQVAKCIDVDGGFFEHIL